MSLLPSLERGSLHPQSQQQRLADLAFQRRVLEEGADEDAPDGDEQAHSDNGDELDAAALGLPGGVRIGPIGGGAWRPINGDGSAGFHDVGDGGGDAFSGAMSLGRYSTEDAIRAHQARLNEAPLYPRSSAALARQYGMDGVGAEKDACCPCACCGVCSQRVKLAITLAGGVALILLVLIIFIVLITRNLGGGPGGPLNKNVFHMQLLGQSVLRYDIRPDENNTLWDGRVGAWQSQWSAMLHGDFVFTDLETAITGPFGGVDWRGSLFSHVAPPESIDSLTAMGVNAFVCSNNHVWDLGVEGMYNLFSALQARNLTCAGAGLNRTLASRATMVTDRELRKSIRLAVVAMASGSVNESAVAGSDSSGPPGVNVLRMDASGELNAEDLARQSASVAAAVKRHSVDLVAVYHHNHLALANASAPPDTVDPWRQRLARGFIDQGAAMYISHGVPYVQAIELYKGAPIFYGLGNFVFQSHAPAGFWSDGSYEGIMVDAQWGCISCGPRTVPITAGAPLMLKLAQQAAARTLSAFPPAAPHSDDGAGAAAPAARGRGEWPSEEDEHMRSFRSSLSAEQLQALEEAQTQGHTSTRPSHSGLHDASHPSLGVPTPEDPDKRRACVCGYKLSSLLLHPLTLVRPDAAEDDVPWSMRFNNSYGLPSLSMARDDARRVLQNVADLSRPYGTNIEIVDNFAPLPPVSRLQSDHDHPDRPKPPPSTHDDPDEPHAMLGAIFARIVLPDD